MGDVISGIGIVIAAADSIRYRVPARYRSNPVYCNMCTRYLMIMFMMVRLVWMMAWCYWQRLC